ncbi:DUF4190 domain-containing protein [Lentibacillus sp. CBA3610]|nr:DUF4190 domain-containing protein [Lentibacillus sp. CBA3610]QKY70699.1 DUF4190 domain-containing protein [Lentibacillus sp. CBA3610]
MSDIAKINSNSIVSLTLGILSIFIPIIGFFTGIAGLVVSRKALKEIDKTNETGRGFAISGLICSIVGIIMHILAILSIVTFVAFISAG